MSPGESCSTLARPPRVAIQPPQHLSIMMLLLFNFRAMAHPPRTAIWQHAQKKARKPHKSQTVRDRDRDEKEKLRKKFKSDHSAEFNTYLINVNGLTKNKWISILEVLVFN